MPAQHSFVRMTHLKRSANATWMFRIDLESTHAEFVENFMLQLARTELFRGGYFVGNWWFDDKAMELISPLFSNWQEMKALAVAVEGETVLAPLTLPEG